VNELDPLPDDVLAKLEALAPPPAAPSLAKTLLPGIRAAAGVAPPWWLMRVPVWMPAMTLLAGVAAGVWLERATQLPPLVRIEIKAPSPVIAVGIEPAPERVVEAIAPLDAGVVRPALKRLPTPVPVPEPVVEQPVAVDRLREERVLIDAARAALQLQRGPQAGLDAVLEHQLAFPQGQLSEEREAIAVQLLLRSGRLEEARARFEAFKRDYPASPLVKPLSTSFSAGQ
jgi:hypothetical protein